VLYAFDVAVGTHDEPIYLDMEKPVEVVVATAAEYPDSYTTIGTLSRGLTIDGAGVAAFGFEITVQLPSDGSTPSVQVGRLYSTQSDYAEAQAQMIAELGLIQGTPSDSLSQPSK